MPASHDLPKLTYAPLTRRPPWMRRFAVRLLLVAACCVLAASGYRAAQHLGVIYARRTIDHWAMPPSVIVFSTVAADVPLALESRYQFLRNGVSLRVSVTQRLLGFAAQAGNVFCGELTGPTGRTRLVLVDTPAADGQMTATALEPQPLGGAPVVVGGYQRGLAIGTDPIRIFAGQRDPQDPSHFTIAYYRLSGSASGTHLIDGWLTEDDQVLLEERRPPRNATTASN